MTTSTHRDRLVSRLVRAGELLVSGEHPDDVAAAFDTERFRFHGPDGFETDYAGLAAYFAALRHAFADRSIRRGLVLVDGDLLACQTWITGTFVRPFTHSPVGLLQPTGATVVMDLINIFRFDGDARLVEEHVRTDNHSLLRALTGGVAAPQVEGATAV